jgi:hypothetical protein
VIIEVTPTDPKRCAAARKDGRPCGSFALPDSIYCFSHAPDRAAERMAARRQGGRNSAKIVRLRGLAPPKLIGVFDVLETALTETHHGTLDPRQASAMAALARAMVSVLQTGEFEERLRRVELERGSHGGIG